MAARSDKRDEPSSRLCFFVPRFFEGTLDDFHQVFRHNYGFHSTLVGCGCCQRGARAHAHQNIDLDDRRNTLLFPVS